MKKLYCIILATLASQLLVAGIARASVTAPNSQSTVCAMPDDDGGTTERF